MFKTQVQEQEYIIYNLIGQKTTLCWISCTFAAQLKISFLSEACALIKLKLIINITDTAPVGLLIHWQILLLQLLSLTF